MITYFDVAVTGFDVKYKKDFRFASTSKVEAMKQAIRMSRLCDNVKGELRATAKVVREEPFTPGICV